MGSTFVLDSSNKVKAFAGAEYPVPFYLQFVPGYVVEVVHGHDDLKYQGDSTINTIIALPHYSEDVHQTRGESLIGNKYRYFPLFRGFVDSPAKGDPVLLCTIGGINYYLGPLNTENNPNWNGYNLFIGEPSVPFNSDVEKNDTLAKGESLNFKKINLKRLAKRSIPELDGKDAYKKTSIGLFSGFGKGTLKKPYKEN